MLIEALAAGVVGAALLWLVLQPIVAPPATPPIDTDPPDPEETPRGMALLALKEIEFDRATGKLSDADYDSLSARYTAAAIAALEPLPGTCVACAFALPAEAVFCPGCGRAVRANK